MPKKSTKSKISDSDKELLKYLEEAVKLERASMRFYATARNKVTNFNMKALLNAFLTVEVQHLVAVTKVRNLVKAKKTSQAIAAAKKFHSTTLDNPFKDMVQWEKLTSHHADIFTLFKGAIQLETKAEKFYSEAAKKVKNPELKAFLRRFAKDEVKHRNFLKRHKESVYNDGYWMGIEHVRLQS
ncbi:ferritin family protein [Nanoarchaeota archaeon]